MKAIVVKAFGKTDQFSLTDMDVPVIREGEVLLKTAAISINPVDAKTRAGGGIAGYLKNEAVPIILGWDIAGVVTASKSDRFKAGDEVFGMVNFPGHGKVYAQYVAAVADQLALQPAGISAAEAAAATLAPLTAWQAFVHKAKLQPGQTVLIHAAAGGVGHYAVQLARHLGAIVTGTSSTKNKDFVMHMGADEHIDYHDVDWLKQRNQFDLVLDTIGGTNLDISLDVAKKGGRVVSINGQLSDQHKQAAADKSIDAYFMLVQSSGKDMEQLAALLKEGSLKSHVSATFPFEEMGKAHEQIESHRTVGKIVVTVQ